MRAGDARRVAAEWVEQVASRLPGFEGAYLAGSIVGLADGEEAAPSSDVDIVLVSPHGVTLPGMGKTVYRGALLEATNLHWDLLSSPEAVLPAYHLAGSFRVDTIIADPAGRLRALQREVAAGFARRTWVRRRCLDAFEKSAAGLASIDPREPFHQQVLSWVFPTGVMAHVPLVAALRNPTVRRRYAAVRQVLAEYGRADVYDQLLDLLGCRMTPAQVAGHLPGLSAMFDDAAAIGRTPFSFSSDISALARPIAIGGSEEMIRSGDHREAVFWMVVTAARCQAILAADAPGLRQAHAPAFEALMADLGLHGASDLQRRAQEAARFLPALWEAAGDILHRNNGITTD
ncbi:MAG: hypothetical protein ACYCYF_02965 [Anaerolineae bacterium]